MGDADWRAAFAGELEAELEAVADWWLRHVVDTGRGTIVGRVTEDNRGDREAPLALVYVARLAWFFSALAARSGAPRHRAAADLCATRLRRDFRDHRHGGLYWTIDADGRPLADKKQTYGQAFAVYALSAHHRATGDAASLREAVALAGEIARHTRDAEHGGYLEARSRDWGPLDDVRLGETDLPADKTLNTHLHLLEAWTALVRVHPPAAPALRELLELYLARFVGPRGGPLPCFYTRCWTLLTSGHSPGHAIEASWLLCEAADALGDPAIGAAVRPAALALAEDVLANGVDAEGGVVTEIEGGRVTDPRRAWWVQAEAMVGFVNAWQLGGDARFLDAARAGWGFVRAHQRDARHGEWRWFSARDAAPEMDKAGPWKGPYHNGRALLELLRRLDRRAAAAG